MAKRRDGGNGIGIKKPLDDERQEAVYFPKYNIFMEPPYRS